MTETGPAPAVLSGAHHMFPNTSSDVGLGPLIVDRVLSLIGVGSEAALPYPEPRPATGIAPLNAGMTSLPNHSSCSRMTL